MIGSRAAATSADPVGERRDFELDSFASEGGALPRATSIDKYERSLGRFIGHLRRSGLERPDTELLDYLMPVWQGLPQSLGWLFGRNESKNIASDLGAWLALIGVIAALLVSGALYFRRAEKTFADVI